MTAVISFMGSPSSGGAVVGGLGVLSEVEARDLFLMTDSDTDRPLEHEHDAERQRERPDDGGGVGEQLLAEQPEPTALEEALLELQPEEGRVGEEPDQQRADEPADEVHPDDIEGVVEPGLELDLDRVAADQAGDGADGDRRHAGDEAGAGG